MSYSISCKRKPERKTDYTEGTLSPSGSEAIEIRVDESHFTDRLDFFAQLQRLIERMREQLEPRP